ncbi:hypothetical protein GCM10018779_64930 [Streptomyces griseocarneus]|nr:hypothetical protein GCM10018779_64930 [Streptomyces griseocarneus]
MYCQIPAHDRGPQSTAGKARAASIRMRSNSWIRWCFLHAFVHEETGGERVGKVLIEWWNTEGKRPEESPVNTTE